MQDQEQAEGEDAFQTDHSQNGQDELTMSREDIQLSSVARLSRRPAQLRMQKEMDEAWRNEEMPQTEGNP